MFILLVWGLCLHGFGCFGVFDLVAVLGLVWCLLNFWLLPVRMVGLVC